MRNEKTGLRWLKPLNRFVHRNRYRASNLITAFQSGGFHSLMIRLRSSMHAFLHPPILQNGIRFRNETPFLEAHNPLYGDIRFTGWAASQNTSEPVEVKILVDGVCISEEIVYFARPTLHRRFPDIPQNNQAGYRFWWYSDQVKDGRHLLEICIRDQTGAEARLKDTIQVDNHNGPKFAYQRWMNTQEKKQQRQILRAYRKSDPSTHFSVFLTLMPAAEKQKVEQTVETLLAQLHERWSLHIAVPVSASEALQQLINKFAQTDARIHLTHGTPLKNESLTGSNGDWLVWLEAGDHLSPYALAALTTAIASQPDTDAFYSDHDHLDADGRRCSPFFKPDWSPDLLRSYNYIGGLLCVKKSAFQAVGGLNEGFSYGAIYDLLLRLSERSDQIKRVPYVLYHRQQANQVQAEALEQHKKALENHCQRQGWQATVEDGYAGGTWRIRQQIAEEPTVAVLIPSNNYAYFQSCLRGLAEATDYAHLEVVFIDTSQTDEMHDLLLTYADHFDIIRYVDQRDVRPFNFSVVNNQAMRAVTSPYVLFLNDDTYPINSDWLKEMVQHILRPEVGCVGAKLLYDDGTIQHTGIIMGIGDGAMHSFQHLNGDDHKEHYHHFPNVVRNVSGVTAACMLTRRDLFWQVGGFDVTDFPLAFQDVDYCLKVLSAGRSIVYTPYAKLYHYESKTKSFQQLAPTTRELRNLRKKWKHVLGNDAFYSPNLRRDRVDYNLNPRRY